MLAGVFHPLTIFLLGLGGGFAIPVLYRLGRNWLHAGFIVALGGLTLVTCVSFVDVLRSGQPIEILTAGALPPMSINMRFGLWEGFCLVGVDLVAVLGAIHLWDRLRGNYTALLLYLILTMGISGMVMTRDLFNLFVFLEIVSIATYGLLGLERTPRAVAAAFKYIVATVIASSFFLLGAVLLYNASGTLNIDELIAGRAALDGAIAHTGLLLLLACLVLELKPFPANGWGLDVYETAPSGVAAMLSVGVSAGVFFALLKLLPLFEAQYVLIAACGGVTFLFANLLGLAQGKVQRLFGYSSVAQMGLLMLALALLRHIGADQSIPLVVGGLFVNHLLAKAGLFWFAGVVGAKEVDGSVRMGPHLLALVAVFVIAIAGLPPFPSFWAKWELVLQLTRAGLPWWCVLILVGSLLEAAYLFRWFANLARSPEAAPPVSPGVAQFVPLVGVALLLAAAGYGAALFSGAGDAWMFAPLVVGLAIYAFDWMPGRIKGAITLFAVLIVGLWLGAATTGIPRLFAVLLLSGSLVIAMGSLHREDRRPGYYPLLAVLILSIMALLRSTTSLELFYHWEIITLASYFLISLSRRALPHVLQFLLFSLASAYFLLLGFAQVATLSGSTDLTALEGGGPPSTIALVLLATGFLIKTAAIGFHVWLAGAYAEAEDDFTAMLSAVVSKVAIVGLLIGTYLAIRSATGLEAAHVMAWAGMLTVVAGALMALGQTDFKRLLAFSSMSQLGYIVTAIALMSHLGWVTALYLVANHMMVKGILFLAVAGIILRAGTRSFAETGGLMRAMPITFATSLVAVISMTGLPPLMGFGGKWLLLSAMTDKGWYMLAAFGVFATFLGFLYAIRLFAGLFLGERRQTDADLREAPIMLLAPQVLLVGGIIVLSLFPKLLMDPVSRAIDPQFAATLVWEGMSLETIYGYWNPVPVALVASAGAAALFALFWGFYRRSRSGEGGLSRFYAYYRELLSRTLPPVAAIAWLCVERATLASARSMRRVYTGDPQTYALLVMLYFLAMYVASEAARIL